MAEDMKRRDFLKSTAATAALAGPGLISARGANNKINVGWIGVGTRDLFHGEDFAYASRLTAAVSQNFRRAQLSALDTALNHEP